MARLSGRPETAMFQMLSAISITTVVSVCAHSSVDVMSAIFSVGSPQGVKPSD